MHNEIDQIGGLISLNCCLISLISGLLGLIAGLISLINGLISLISGLISIIRCLICIISGVCSLISGLISLVNDQRSAISVIGQGQLFVKKISFCVAFQEMTDALKIVPVEYFQSICPHGRCFL